MTKLLHNTNVAHNQYKKYVFWTVINYLILKLLCKYGYLLLLITQENAFRGNIRSYKIESGSLNL